MTRIQLTRLFLLALSSTTALACGDAKVPTAIPVTTSPTVDAQSPADDPDSGPTAPTSPDPALPDGGAADQSVDAASATDDLCTRFCAVLLTIACAPDVATCQAGCTADLAGACAAEATADYECEAALTAADYTCDARGRIRLNPGKCDDLQTAFGDCLLGGGP